MASVPNCQAHKCAMQATYFHKIMMVHVCEEHCQPEQVKVCFKLKNVDAIDKTLEVVKACTKNFEVDSKLQINRQAKEDSKNFSEKIMKTVIEYSEEISKAKQQKEWKIYESFDEKVRSLVFKLKHNELFMHFCSRNYLTSMGNHLKMETDQISQFIQNENYPDLFQKRYDQLRQDFEDLRAEYQDFKKRAIDKLNPSTNLGLTKFYSLITNRNVKFSKYQGLRLDCGNEKDATFMKELGAHILPNLPSLKIFNIQDKIGLVRDFVISSIPEGIRFFSLNCKGKLTKWNEIEAIIEHISPKIYNTIELENIDISEPEFVNLIKIVSKNQTKIVLIDCKIGLDSVPHFQDSLKGSVLSHLDFGFCRTPDKSDWKNHPERFSNLIEGLSQSEDMKKKLKFIDLFNCGISSEHAERVLHKFGFGHVEVWNLEI
ncbi:unnamed protein product [Moneuplotes crassus]|uniref:Uncharacterized protein n=1 Tax=Euplotes crassus TaxID=5936 RepID=A0AAD1UI87_EUPCR|nr:unnamed protein product [Moneuplotes crassus]